MLLNTEIQANPSLQQIINNLDVYSNDMSFGPDIDEAHKILFDKKTTKEEASTIFRRWAAKYQPCLFGRLGSKQVKGVDYDLCWLNSEDIAQGDAYLIDTIQNARRQWKDRAMQGLVSGLLIMFQDERLARAKPGNKLLDACQKISELYIIENAPLERDTIYTEAVPFEREGKYGLFKAGINVFYPGAHRTLNHDRRLPGGLLISANSPGHLAHSLVKKGVMDTFANSVQWVFETAMHSIGNGGMSHKDNRSNSWHNAEHDEAKLAKRCPIPHRPPHVPENYSGRTYSATYHTDVLLPTDVTIDGELDKEPTDKNVWPYLVIDYISTNHMPNDHLNYGLFHPHPITPEAKYHNPWPPRKAYNSPLFDY